jgi:hypothetical protein
MDAENDMYDNGKIVDQWNRIFDAAYHFIAALVFFDCIPVCGRG